jgi:hypothetical protein
MPWDPAFARFLRGPGERERAADIQAVDRGEGRTLFCSFRATYGSYPRSFRGYMLDLTPEGLVLRPVLLLGFLSRRIPARERIESARVRPFQSEREARSLLATGLYAPGDRMGWAGMEVITCETAAGVLEFAVKRPDVALVLHYLDGLRRLSGQSPEPGQ